MESSTSGKPAAYFGSYVCKHNTKAHIVKMWIKKTLCTKLQCFVLEKEIWCRELCCYSHLKLKWGWSKRPESHFRAHWGPYGFSCMEMSTVPSLEPQKELRIIWITITHFLMSCRVFARQVKRIQSSFTLPILKGIIYWIFLSITLRPSPSKTQGFVMKIS